MQQMKVGQAGSLESNDLMVTVDLNYDKGIQLEIESIVKERFGRQIDKVVRETLKELNVSNAYIKIIDKGALDFAIIARLKTAIRRAERRQ